jgi:hypothetical protein
VDFVATKTCAMTVTFHPDPAILQAVACVATSLPGTSFRARLRRSFGPSAPRQRLLALASVHMVRAHREATSRRSRIQSSRPPPEAPHPLPPDRGPEGLACRPWRPRRPSWMGFRLTRQTTDGSVPVILGIRLDSLPGPVVTSPLSLAAAGRALFPTSYRVKFSRIADEAHDRNVIPKSHFQSL